jgi:hypothetical protein
MSSTKRTRLGMMAAYTTCPARMAPRRPTRAWRQLRQGDAPSSTAVLSFPPPDHPLLPCRPRGVAYTVWPSWLPARTAATDTRVVTGFPFPHLPPAAALLDAVPRGARRCGCGW